MLFCRGTTLEKVMGFGKVGLAKEFSAIRLTAGRFRSGSKSWLKKKAKYPLGSCRRGRTLLGFMITFMAERKSGFSVVV